MSRAALRATWAAPPACGRGFRGRCGPGPTPHPAGIPSSGAAGGERAPVGPLGGGRGQAWGTRGRPPARALAPPTSDSEFMSVFYAQTRDEGTAQLGSKSRKIRSVERRCGTVVVTVNALIQKGWREGQNKQLPASGSPCSPRGPGQIRKRFLRGAGLSPLPRSLINRCEFTER